MGMNKKSTYYDYSRILAVQGMAQCFVSSDNRNGTVRRWIVYDWKCRIVQDDRVCNGM